MGDLADREIEESIHRSLAADSRVDTGEIDVSAEDRTVFLSGTVDSAAERQAVLENVMATPRVDGAIDQLRLRNFVERTDEELTEAVKHALARDITVDERPLSVQAREGEVTLTGHVDSRSRKNTVEDVAWWTPGVTNVVSHLQVEEEIPADLKE